VFYIIFGEPDHDEATPRIQPGHAEDLPHLQGVCLSRAMQMHAFVHDAYSSGGKINFLSHLGEKMLENPQKFMGIHSTVASNRSKAQAKNLEKLH